MHHGPPAAGLSACVSRVITVGGRGGASVGARKAVAAAARVGRDRPEHLTEAFTSSVLEQTRPPDQVVIVRDGPVDAALAATIAELAATSPVPVDVVGLDRNIGLGPALDAGLAACRHDVVARMDADDISLPHRFAVQMPIIEAGQDIVGSGLVEFGAGAEDVVGRRMPPTDPDDIRARSRFADPFNHPTVVYRRTCVQAVGGYSDFALMEDYLLWAKMIVAGAQVANVAEPLVLYRVGAGAYRRRGGLAQLRAELGLQRRLRRLGFTTGRQYLRNVVVRGGLPARARTGAPDFVSKGHRHLPGVTVTWHDRAVWPTLPRRPAPSIPGPSRPRRGPAVAPGHGAARRGAARRGRRGAAARRRGRRARRGRPAGPRLPRQRRLAGLHRAAARLVAHGHVRFAGRLGVAYASSATSTARRGRCGSPWTRRAGGVQRLRDPAARHRPVGRGGHVLRHAADAGDPQAPANLVALYLEAGDLIAAAEMAERYADESRPDTVVALADVRAARAKPDAAEGPTCGPCSWAGCGRTPRTARSCSRLRRRGGGGGGVPRGVAAQRARLAVHAGPVPRRRRRGLRRPASSSRPPRAGRPRGRPSCWTRSTARTRPTTAPDPRGSGESPHFVGATHDSPSRVRDSRVGEGDRR